MLTAMMVAQGDLGPTADVVADVYACTRCGGCERSCHHHNPAGDTLASARSALLDAGLAPKPIVELLRELEQASTSPPFDSAGSYSAAQVKASTSDASLAILVGCNTDVKEVAATQLLVSALMKGEHVPLVRDCCGGIQASAGATGLGNAKRSQLADLYYITLDPECARHMLPARRAKTLSEWIVGQLEKDPQTLRVDLAAQVLPACAIRGEANAMHALIALLNQVAPGPISEGLSRFTASYTGCSGAGDLLPVSLPDAAEQTRDRALRGTDAARPLVTTCPRAYSAFNQSREANKTRDVQSLSEWLARAIGVTDERIQSAVASLKNP
jgi:ferredoxin